MSVRFVIRHAMREGRASWKRLGLYMSSITLGVAALVAINSFRSNAVASIDNEARSLLGADLRLTSNRVWPDSVQAIIDTAETKYQVAHVTTLVSMGVNAATLDTRLVQLRSVSAGYPFYRDVTTAPAGEWAKLQDGGRAIVEENLLTQLDIAVGDTLLLGERAFVIAAKLVNGPADFSFRNIMGPRVYIADKDLESTGLLQFGSLAQYQAFLRIPDAKELQTFVDRRHRLFSKSQVGFDTAEEQGEDLATALGHMSRFLGLVGLAALLLGGIGVATAVHVFVKEKRGVVAVLRCLGARERTVFAAYLLQASVLSLAGAVVGVLLGFVVQALLPQVMSALVPFDVPFAIDWVSVAAGLGVGLLVAVLFAIVPLLGIRGISPLQALRVEYEPAQRRVDVYRVLALLALLLGITGLCVWQADKPAPGMAFAGALGATLLVLSLVAWVLTKLARRLVPKRVAFPIRQGIANLYRPHNQTVAVTLSLGFGVFVIATMLTVQSNLLGWLNIEARANAPNVLAFDIQPDQLQDVQDLFAQHRARAANFTPIVPATIRGIRGEPVDSLLRPGRPRIAPWALRREYRNTYRDTVVSTEKVVAGRWFGSGAGAKQPVPISIEQDVARDLTVKLGDAITWDFQGVLVETQVTSIRKVDWAQFNTNFFVVFPTGVLESAPQTFVGLGRLDGAAERGALQRDLVAAQPNVSVVDLASVREAFDQIIGKVTLAIRFMALFSIIAGVIVLVGAVATSRFQRLRESALLKTIGASRRQIRQVLITEYAALGALAGFTGVILAGFGSWGLVKYLFKLDYHVPFGSLFGVWVGVVVLAVVIGLLNSRDVFRREPLAVLREV